VPRDGVIRTAVAIGEGVNVIEMSGPWETFQDAAVAHAAGRFELFTVAATKQPVVASGGLTLDPTYSYRNCAAAARRRHPGPQRDERDGRMASPCVPGARTC
jgi:transcriptional regulator GlxA family with amidase domain